MRWTETHTEHRAKPPYEKTKGTEVCYTNSDLNCRLSITCFIDDGEQRPHEIHVLYESDNPKLCQIYLEKNLTRESTDQSASHWFSFKNPGHYSKSELELYQFIMIFIRFHELEHNEIHRQLFLLCHLDFNQINEKVISKISSLVSESKIEEAIENASELQNHLIYDPIWWLANELLEQRETSRIIDCQRTYEVFSRIKEENPHYKAAQLKMYDIITFQSQAASENPYLLLEEKFIRALNSGLQREADLLFHELCGNSFGEPAISNIQGNPEVLFQMAEKIRELNQRNKTLAEVNKKLLASPDNSSSDPSSKSASGLWRRPKRTKSLENLTSNDGHQRSGHTSIC